MNNSHHNLLTVVPHGAHCFNFSEVVANKLKVLCSYPSFMSCSIKVKQVGFFKQKNDKDYSNSLKLFYRAGLSSSPGLFAPATSFI